MKQLLVLLLLASPLARSATDLDQVGESRGIIRITEVFNRLNPVLTKNHLAPLTFTPSDLLVFHPEDINRKIKVWELQTLNISLRFLPGNFEVLSFYRNDINYTPGSGFDQPPKPNWTEEQAIASAKSYVGAIFDRLPTDVGPPIIKYETQRYLRKDSSVMKYYPGIWHIQWPRVDAQGHLFNGDTVNVWISEDQGITAAAINFFSIYKKPQGPIISQDDALKIADLAAESLVTKWIGGGLQLGSHKIIEGIVNPNHILQAKTVEDFAAQDTIGRLAWVIFYDLTANGATLSGHKVQVWVDAETKQVIGGDLH